jgi:hypothetical protein
MYQAKLNPQWVLKPQDLVVLVRLSVQDGAAPTYAQLAQELGLTASEIHAGVARSIIAQLAFKDDAGKPKVLHDHLLEFVTHGLRFAFPAVRGEVVRGIPTSFAAPPLNEMLPQTNLPPVWPYKQGSVKGEALYPLYPSVAKAALASPMLHELLALLDAARSGETEQRALAVQLLGQCWQA